MIDLEFILQFCGVIGLVAFGDVCWTFYFIKTADRQAAHAAAWSAIVIACGAFSTVAYVHDLRLIVAAMFGAFLGTYFTIRFFPEDQEENSE